MNEENRNIIKSDQLHLIETPYVIGTKNGKALKEPEISVKKEEGLVKAIEVKCVCGKVINIECG